MVVYGRSVQPSGWLGRVRLTESHEHPTQLRDPWPDLADGATRGAVLALLREAERVPDLVITTGLIDGWFANPSRCGRQHTYKTEAEALVAALEAVP